MFWNIVLGLFLMGFGAWATIGAVQDADWFMERGRAQSTVDLLGRDGARVVYAILGVMFIGIGLLALVTSGN